MHNNTNILRKAPSTQSWRLLHPLRSRGSTPSHLLVRKLESQSLPGRPPFFLTLLQLLSLLLVRLSQVLIRLLGRIGLLDIILAHNLLVFLSSVPRLLLPAANRGDALVMKRKHRRVENTVLQFDSGVSDYVPGEVLRLLWPDERFPQLDSHALDGLRPSPSAKISVVTVNTGDGLLLNVTANADNAHAIYTLEVVAEIELVEVERDAELGIARGEKGGSDEGDCEFRTVKESC